jgi:polynucleotide 5'-kinase involved in rRNA processing
MIIKEIEKGKTLIIRGPSRVTLLKGKVDVFGRHITPVKHSETQEQSEINEEDVLIIPSANTLPFYALEDSKLEIYTNREENLLLIENSSIPEKWIKIKDATLKRIKKSKDSDEALKIMVLGISCGKTTLIKYLANNFMREGLKGGYLDSDLGQQIMYLPTTISIGELTNPIIFSEDLTPENTVFIGATFPKGNYKFIVSKSSADLIDEYLQDHPESDFILIDTDGWIKTDAGIIYKNYFIDTVDPDILIVFHDETVEELKAIEDKAKEGRKDRDIHLITERNEFFYEKDKDERRFMRQSQFAKILEEYRKISIPLSRNEIEFIKTEYDPETDTEFEKPIPAYELTKLPYHYVIIALLDENSELIKLGLLFFINLEKDYMLIFSDLTYKEQLRIKKVLMGSLRLSTKGNHQGYLYL